MPRRSKRKWHEIDLLCRSGAGIAAIAPLACRLLREFVGADAAALFWMNDDGLPAGFFHEDSPASARDLFANEFERLFQGPDELNVANLAQRKGAIAGHLLAPPDVYYRSNTFNLLVRPSGHRHALDLRIDHGGRARLIVLLFRTERTPFCEDDLAALKTTAAPLRRAIAGDGRGAEWEPTSLGGHALFDLSGESLLMISETARQILQKASPIGEGIRLEGPITAAPRFVRMLCASAAGGCLEPRIIPMPEGRLVVTPELLNAPIDGRRAILLTLRIERPRNLRLVERLLGLPLSPAQRTIMLDAALGADRNAIIARNGTSAEGMKKHLAAIYDRTGARSWEAMIRMLDSSGSWR